MTDSQYLNTTVYSSFLLKQNTMEKIIFQKSGDPIKLKFELKKEKLSVDYSLELLKNRYKKSHLIYLGDNYKNVNQFHFLPSPINENHERILAIDAYYTGFETNIDKIYLMVFEVYQVEILLISIEHKGPLSSSEKNVILLFQLIMIE